MARAQAREPQDTEQPTASEAEDKESQEGQAESTDGPLLDMSDAAVKKLIKQAKARGYVTYDELNEVLPSAEVSSEQIEDTMSMLAEMGINVVETEEESEEVTEGAAPEAAVPVKVERAVEPIDRTDDPVRMYLREMGSVELLSREGEIAIAKRIEAGREAMIHGLCESPLTFQAIIIWRDELNEGKVLLRDIIDLEATYAGPDAKAQMPRRQERRGRSDQAGRAPPRPQAEGGRAARAAHEAADLWRCAVTGRFQQAGRGRRGRRRRREEANVSLAAMEAELKPQVLETFDRIAKTYKSLRKLQDQEVGRRRPSCRPHRPAATRSCAKKSSSMSSRSPSMPCASRHWSSSSTTSTSA